MDQVTQYVIVTCSNCSMHFGMLWGWALFFKVVLFSELALHLMMVGLLSRVGVTDVY